MTPEQKRLADRILKIMALAVGTRFAAEANTARQMADELMQKHGLGADDLASAEGSKDRTKLGHEHYVPAFKGAKWEFIIVDALTDLCNCTFFFNEETLANYALVGTVADLEVLRYMLGEIHRQRIAAWLDYKRSGPDSFSKFCYAYAQGLAAKIDMAVNKAALAEQHKLMRLWYETNVLHRPVNNVAVKLGVATSEAGGVAGRGVTLNRGALPSATKRIGYRG